MGEARPHRRERRAARRRRSDRDHRRSSRSSGRVFLSARQPRQPAAAVGAVHRARHGRDLRPPARRDRPLARVLRRRRRRGDDDPRLPADQLRLGAGDRLRARVERRDRLCPGPDHHPPAAAAVRRDARRPAVLGGLPDLADQQPEPDQRRIDPDRQPDDLNIDRAAATVSPSPAGSCSPSVLVLFAASDADAATRQRRASGLVAPPSEHDPAEDRGGCGRRRRARRRSAASTARCSPAARSTACRGSCRSSS